MNNYMRNIFKGVLVLSLFFCPLLPAHADGGDAIIAVVNDDVITMRDLRQYIAGVAGQMRLENRSPQEVQKILQEYEQRGLDRLIEDKLILAAADAQGLKVNDDAVDKRLQEIEDRYPSEDVFIRALDAQGMTITDLRRRLLDQMKVQYEIDMQVRDKIMVNPQDVTDYYNNHLGDFYQKPAVDLQSIFVSFGKYGKQEARSRADEARSRLMAGEDFNKVFQKYSDGSSIGEVEKGEMADAVEKVVFNLKPGEVSDPVEVANGIYIFKLISATKARQQPLADVKDQIYNKLLDGQFKADYKKYVDKLRQKAYVEIK
ncbi:MAG: peptidyl-prolyl cis-trans isomerase [Candidatus Omnitrophica bacterium]|nr:peptidyl-prolyl cis-trans isomerase [Candidatus Omnitrophota bacterium]MDE2008821.1 peptidyl-prolyl cis-trans isomerase [Candidatus Omnitrophota bacterium]MDE2230483.1 peptidyl-prolyl cis-trans isomerase [Candidatus Omnitrophota bacterium]